MAASFADAYEIISRTLPDIYRLLQIFATRENFGTQTRVAFGTNFNAEQLEALRQQWEIGNFEEWPTIEVRSSSELNGANGAYAAAIDKIYLSQEYLEENRENLAAITSLVLEEIGHFVDAQINDIDSDGDEGKIFSKLVQDNHISSSQLQILKTENDTTHIEIDHQTLRVETANTFDIELDYGLINSSSFLNNTLARNVLEKAVSVWEDILNGLGEEFPNLPQGSQVKLDATTTLQNVPEIDDLRIYVNTTNLGVGVAEAGPAFSVSGDKLQIERSTGSDFEPWAGSISFDQNSTQFYFDATPDDLTDDLTILSKSNQIDFFSVAVHEIGHVLGLGGSSAYNALIPTFDPAKPLPPNALFTGINAQTVNNDQPVPLTSQTGTFHVDASPNGTVVGNPSSAPVQTLMAPVYTTGIRLTPQPLDIAMLKDIGYRNDLAVAGEFIDSIVDGIQSAIDAVISALDGVFQGQGLSNSTGSLPLLGGTGGSSLQESQLLALNVQAPSNAASNFSEATGFLKNIATQISDKFSEFEGAENVADSKIRDALFDLFGPEGLKLLQDSNRSGDINFQDIQLDVNGSIIQYNLTLGGRANAFEVELPNDIGLPQFGFQLGNPKQPGSDQANASIDLDYSFDLGFGIDTLTGEFFLDTGSNQDLSVSLQPDFDIAAMLGVLQVEAQDNGSQLDFSLNLGDGDDDKVTLSELSNLQTDATGAANIKLDLTTSFDGLASLPSISSDFNLQWSFTESGGTPDVSFDNTELDLSSFFQDFTQPALANINDVLSPIRPIITALTTNIDFLTNEIPRGLDAASLLDIEKEVTPGDVTLLDLLVAIDTFGGSEFSIPGLNESLKFFKAVLEIDSLISFVSSRPDGTLPLEGFDFTDILDENDPSDLDIRLPNFSLKDLNLESLPDNNKDLTSSSASEFVETLGEGFEFPILTNPQRAFEFLLGKTDVELFTYDLPPLRLEANIPDAVKIPLLPPLFATFGTNLAAEIDLNFGYDTHGIESLSTIDDLFNGFFIEDANGKNAPDILLSGGIRGGLSLDAEAIVLTGGANIGAGVNFFLADGSDNDGKLRFSELEQGWFDKITGEIFAFLDASAEIPVGEALQTLITGPASGATTVTKFLRDITEDAGLLGDGFELLDKGANFIKDGIKSGIDFVFGGGGESNGPSFVLFEVQTPKQVLFSLDLFSQNGETVPSPILATPDGNQLLLNIGERANFRVNVNTEDSGETFTVTSQPGESNIQVSAFGYTQDYPTPNKIVANAGQGDDFISIEVNIPTELNSQTGNDELYGGSVNDTLKGGDDDDFLDGRAGADSLFGGGGKDRLNGGEDDDFLDGGTNNDRLEGEQGEDTLLGGEGADQLTGGPGNDSMEGGPENDSLLGTEGSDTLNGNDGSDFLDGGSQNDILFGENGNDILWGGTGEDFLSGGLQDDRLFGQSGNDTLVGHDGEDLLAAGIGDDSLDGGAQNDLLFGEAGNDSLYGDRGDDSIDGFDGNDF